MAGDDFPNTNFSLIEDDLEDLTRRFIDQTIPLNSTSQPKLEKSSWSLRFSQSASVIGENRKSFEENFFRQTKKSSNISINSSILFRYFDLKLEFLRQIRSRLFSNEKYPFCSFSPEKNPSPPRLEVRHILTTILITVFSVMLLVSMIVIDLVYLNDSIPTVVPSDLLRSNTRLCFRYPTICFMKGLVIIVFLIVTILLCYSVLRLYTRAKRHSLSLERKTTELEKEKSLTQQLLHQILPPCVAKDLINGRQAPAEFYDSVTVYFSDIVGFTGIASHCSPTETCDMLNQLYLIFDALLENFDVYKVETIGDAYMVVSGAPNRNGNRHPNEIINMALALLRGKQHVRVPRTFAELQLRVGIHTGPVCAAVIGSKMPRYCMFGDTVNVASRMESTGLPEHIHLSNDTYERISNRDKYAFDDRGEIHIKGKGLMRTYFLRGIKSDIDSERSRTNCD